MTRSLSTSTFDIAAMQAHAQARGGVQVAGAGVVAKPGPLRQYFVE